MDPVAKTKKPSLRRLGFSIWWSSRMVAQTFLSDQWVSVRKWAGTPRPVRSSAGAAHRTAPARHHGRHARPGGAARPSPLPRRRPPRLGHGGRRQSPLPVKEGGGPGHSRRRELPRWNRGCGMPRAACRWNNGDDHTVTHGHRLTLLIRCSVAKVLDAQVQSPHRFEMVCHKIWTKRLYGH